MFAYFTVGTALVAGGNPKVIKPHATAHPTWRKLSFVIIAFNVVLGPIGPWLCAQPSIWQTCVGLPLNGLGVALFAWTQKQLHGKKLTLMWSSDEPDQLLTNGPFAYVRHPIYTAYILSFCGAAITVQLTYVMISTALVILVYVLLAFFEEDKMQKSALASQYQQYKHRTGMFWPKLW